MGQVPVDKVKARLLAAVEQLEVQSTTYPRQLTNLAYGIDDLTSYVVSLTFDGNQAIITCEFPLNYKPGPRPFGSLLDHLWGEKVSGTTEQGEKFEAAHAYAVGANTDLNSERAVERITIKADHWRLTYEEPCLWVGRLEGKSLPSRTRNLRLEVHTSSHQSFKLNNFGLSGSKWQYYILKGGRNQASDTLIVDTDGKPLDPKILGAELQALSYCIGGPLYCNLFLGLDEHGATVAYAGGDYGFDRLRPNHHFPPVPAEINAAWFTLFFKHLVRKLNAEPVDEQRVDYLYEAVHLYVESTAEVYNSSREVKILLACLAMARWFVGKEPILVHSPIDWQDWVSNEPAFRAFADPDLENKLRSSVEKSIQPGIVELIELALEKAELPKNAVLMEAVQLSSELIVGKATGREYKDSEKQCLFLRSLCSGLMAVAIGYKGPISSWEDDKKYISVNDRGMIEWFPVDHSVRPDYYLAYVDEKLEIVRTSELWPVFERPSVPKNSLVAKIEEFANRLSPRTGAQVKARVMPLPRLAEQKSSYYDFTLQSVPVPLASTVLFTIEQAGSRSELRILNWEEEVEPINNERTLTKFLGEVAQSSRTRHAIERLLLLTPETSAPESLGSAD